MFGVFRKQGENGMATQMFNLNALFGECEKIKKEMNNLRNEIDLLKNPMGRLEGAKYIGQVPYVYKYAGKEYLPYLLYSPKRFKRINDYLIVENFLDEKITYKIYGNNLIEIKLPQELENIKKEE